MVYIYGMAERETSGTSGGRNGSESHGDGCRSGRRHPFRGGIRHDTDPQPCYNRNRSIKNRHDNSSTRAFQPYQSHHQDDMPLKFCHENSASSRLRSHRQNGRTPVPLGPSPRVYSDGRISKRFSRWERRREEAQSEDSSTDSEPERDQCAVDCHDKPEADRQFQIFSERMRLLKDDIKRCSHTCLEPDAMDTSWDPEPNISMRLKAIEMVATVVPVNGMIQVYYEILSTCYAEHDRSVGGWIELTWGILSYHSLEQAFHERWKQEGVTADLSSADQAEFIFELLLSEMVVRHNNAAVKTGGQQWTLDNLKRFAQQFLVPCHYDKDCPFREVSHRHRLLPF
jgi:hypothetical protein